MVLDIVYSEDYKLHRQYTGHPDRPERLVAIKEALEESNVFNPVPPERMDESILTMIHDEDYIKELKNHYEGALDADTYWRTLTYDIALLAASGAITAAKRTWEYSHGYVALVRPPGHHAGRDYYGGFCYFNNIAIAAEYMLRNGAKKVAIVDIDVHHGNGTADIFSSRNDVLYISTHQWGIFPGTGHETDVGKGDGRGYTVNIPFRSGTGDATYIEAMEEIIIPVIEDYKPDIILVSLGLDAHVQDPLADLTLSSKGYTVLTMALNQLAKEICHGRIAYVLEGGYNLEALADSLKGIVLEGDVDSYEYDASSDVDYIGMDVIEKVKSIQKEFWGI